MKEFYGELTHIRRVSFRCEAETIEEAKEKMLQAYPDGDHFFVDGKVVGTLEGTDDWHNVDEPRQGNVREHSVKSFEIQEE